MRRAVIPLLGLVIAACTSAPALTPVPAPTRTSWPTLTPYPSRMPLPTPTSPAPTPRPTVTAQPTATAVSEPTYTPPEPPTPTGTPDPTSVALAASAVEGLRATWGIPFGSSVIVADICSELVITAEQLRAGDIAQAEAQAAITASGAALDAIADPVAQWTPDEAQAPYRDGLQHHIEQARATLAQWLNGEIPPDQASIALSACSQAAQDTLWTMREAMIADGFSEDVIQQMVGQLVVSLEGLAIAGTDPTALADILVSSATATPEGAPAALEALEALNHHSHVEGESFHIVGEVRNNSATPMESVRVTATLYDDSGQVVGSSVAFAALDFILPDGRSPFEIATDEWAGTTRYELQVEGLPRDVAGQDLVVVAHEGIVDGDWLDIRGEVQNTGDTSAELVRVIITLYDGAGNVVAMGDTFATLDVIPPGETSPFEIRTVRHPDVDRYEIQVQGH
jgi:hypothetical protein